MCSCVAISGGTGLGSHAFESWQDRHSPYMWLRDALPEYLPNARVMIYGYDSTLVGSHSFQSLGDIGSTFRASLKVALGPVPRERPLIFLAHSLGGLVLKEAMVQMVSGNDADSRNFKATFGILFFGVPNQGMDISSLLSMVHGQPNLHFLLTLSKDGGLLQNLIEKFQATFAFQDSHIYSFYETDMSPTAKEGEPGRWSMTGDPTVLVDRHSARSGRSWEGNHLHLPIKKSHSEMVKFPQYDPDCDIVCDILRQFGQDARGVISRRWWWWEKKFAPKISFSGNPVFKMLFQNLSAPNKEIAKFMQLIINAQKIRPLLKKLHVRRQILGVQKSSQLDDKYPQSLLSPHQEPSQDTMYDSSSVSAEPVSPPTKKARLDH